MSAVRCSRIVDLILISDTMLTAIIVGNTSIRQTQFDDVFKLSQNNLDFKNKYILYSFNKQVVNIVKPFLQINALRKYHATTTW